MPDKMGGIRVKPVLRYLPELLDDKLKAFLPH